MLIHMSKVEKQNRMRIDAFEAELDKGAEENQAMLALQQEESTKNRFEVTMHDQEDIFVAEEPQTFEQPNIDEQQLW